MITQHPNRSAVAAGLLALMVTGCLERELAPLNPCLVSTVSRKVAVTNIDKVDLLFMVDNSDSMTSKQNSLKAQFPRMVQVLSTGMRTANDPNPFPAVKDMHLAVVSSDMGTPGQMSIMGCTPEGGDDGRLKHNSSGDPGCQTMYPPFLAYDATRDNPMQIGTDFACIASLGVGGCNYESQLEAPLKALFPAIYTDKDSNIVVPNPIMFLGPQKLGRRDLPPPEGSAGFLRNDPNDMSLLAVILLTDEDDQSSQNTDYLRMVTDPADPLAGQSILTKPFMNQASLYDVKRYIDGYHMLRPANPELIVFAAIAGVPVELTDARARANVDFTDRTQREAYYDRIANSPAMQQRVVGIGQAAALNPACSRVNAMRQQETAVPARRILQVVRSFEENGTIQSICANDYGPAMDAIIEIIARQLGAVCLPRPLIRRADGNVPCNVVWELPPPNAAPIGAPTACNQRPFLKPVDSGRRPVNERGGVNCKVEQLPILSDAVPQGAGWYYDNFTPGVAQSCAANRRQRLTFTEDATPDNGVTVKLECVNEVQTLPATNAKGTQRTQQLAIGEACATTGPANMPTTGRGGRGTPAAPTSNACGGASRDAAGLFCHKELNVCVQGCQSTDDCPAAWVCDNRPETMEASGGRAFCTNPTCGVE